VAEFQKQVRIESGGLCFVSLLIKLVVHWYCCCKSSSLNTLEDFLCAFFIVEYCIHQVSVFSLEDDKPC